MEIQYSGQSTEKDFARMYRLATPLKPKIVAIWILSRSTSRLPLIAASKAQIFLYGILILAAILMMLVYNFSNTGSR